MLPTTESVRLGDGSYIYGNDPDLHRIANAIKVLRQNVEKISEEQKTEIQNILNNVVVNPFDEAKIMWDKRNAFGERLKSLMKTLDDEWAEGDKYRIIRWNRNNDIRVYITYKQNQKGDNIISYYATGNQWQQPKTMQACKAFKESAELRQLVADIAADKTIGEWVTG